MQDSYSNLLFQLTQLPPLSLYIHIPWCVKKCPYCDFNSHNQGKVLPQQEYIDALSADLEDALPLIWGRTIHSIFIGGGTPSLFSGAAIDQILSMVRRLTNLSPLAEITLEANPGTVDNTHIAEYRRAGVNRISFGIQSFNDQHLQRLGRIHDSKTAIKAIEIGCEHFAGNVNLDIIYGLPQQTLAELEQDINQALNFSPNHLSFYNLTIEPNTLFYKNIPSGMPDNDLCYTMQDLIVHNLAKSGYQHYETSAYAKHSHQCWHNLNYWLFGDYLGIGAGAHSKLSFHDKIIRQARQKQPQSYMTSVHSKTHIRENILVNLADLPFEFFMNTFRLLDGIPLVLFVERVGLPLNIVLNKLDIAQTRGFIKLNGQKIVPTQLGQDFLNDLLMLFLEPDTITNSSLNYPT